MLREISLFQDLPEDQLDFLISITHQFTYPKGSILLTQGELSNSLFVVLEGRLKVFATAQDGRQTLLAFLGPGDFVGELSLLDDGPHASTVQTVEDTRTMLVTQDVFHRFVDTYPENLLPMLRILAARLRALDETICSLSTLDVYGRVARVLLQEAQDLESDGLMRVPRMTHQDIAEMVGSSREMVSRIMKDLRQGGYIRLDSKKRILLQKKLPSRW
ncbi:MAG: Crp/Fnr family transcriptional regulator [Thiolinea sp.]